MPTQQYETQVAFYPRYNYGATAMMREPLVDQMNKIVDDLYENRFDELYIQNSYREVEGTQINVPSEVLPEEMSHFIIEMSRGYLVNSGLHPMEVDYSTIPLEIDKIWTTDSKENDYTPAHSHYGLVAGVFYLKVPEQCAAMNDEGNFCVHHDEPGYVDMNPLQSIRPKGLDVIIPQVGMFTCFPSWVKHSVTPFFGEGIRRAVAWNVVCPTAKEWVPKGVPEAIRERRKVKKEEVLKINTEGGPDAKQKLDDRQWLKENLTGSPYKNNA